VKGTAFQKFESIPKNIRLSDKGESMKRTSGLIFASTLMLMCPTYAFAQYDSFDRQCIYSPHLQNSVNIASAQVSVPAELPSSLPAPLPTETPESKPIPSYSGKAELNAVAPADTESVDGKALNGKISKNHKAGKHPLPLSLKVSDDQFTLLTGSTFSIELENELTSKEAAAGDKVLAHLSQDLQVGSVLLAPKGAKVEGSVHKVFPACKGIKSNKLNGHFRNSNGGLQLEFTRLLGSDGTDYTIAAIPAAGSDVHKLSAQEQKMVISKHGEVGVPYHTKRYETIAFAITAGSMAAGPFGFAAAPAMSALIGGVCPAYGLGRPAKPGEKHPRVKGALMGALRGSPGGFLTSGLFVHGLDAKVSSGDQIILQLSQPLSLPTAGKEISSAQQ
jgi:hypothetical protein